MKTSALLYNLIGIVLSLLVLKACFQQPGYSFIKKMLSSNYEVIKTHKNLNVEERYAIKLGIGYSAFKYVRENTPDSAVILLPRREDFMPENQKSRFGGEVYKIMWASRFLHPRKIVSRYTLEKGNAAYQPTHVIVVNDSCKEFIDYPIPAYVEFGVFPVKHPKQH